MKKRDTRHIAADSAQGLKSDFETTVWFGFYPRQRSDIHSRNSFILTEIGCLAVIGPPLALALSSSPPASNKNSKLDE